MNREEAHRLLDTVRAGVYVPTARINEALAETGDLDSAITTRLLIEASHEHLEAA